jgi:hypothetical protein
MSQIKVEGHMARLWSWIRIKTGMMLPLYDFFIERISPLLNPGIVARMRAHSCSLLLIRLQYGFAASYGL